MLAITVRCLAMIGLSFVALSLPAPALAQMPTPTPVVGTTTAELTAKVTNIDRASRTVTLQDDQGNKYDMQVGPNVTRFDNVKLGEVVTFTYQQSVALSIAKSTAPMPSVASTPIVTAFPGSKPSGGVVTRTLTAVVTVQAIDTSNNSITVKTQDGRVVTLSVKDPANLNGIKVGDAVKVTYTQALVIAVK